MMMIYQRVFCLMLFEVPLYIRNYLFRILYCNEVYFCAENFIHPHFLILCTPQNFSVNALFEVLLIYTEKKQISYMLLL